ncbi:hypothetical protein JXQ70_03645 [bacterium]|nr:hypothetical protein [bacterium]
MSHSHRFVGFVLLVMLNALLLLPLFRPNLDLIDKDDETWYINSGRSLVHGYLPDYAHSPLSAFFYALLYLPFEQTDFWLVHMCSVGRFILFVLSWVSFGLICLRFKPDLAIISLALMFISPVLINMIWNPSDLLFTICAALAFWQTLSFLQTRLQRHVCLASFCIGLSALARSDGLCLCAVFIVFVLGLRSRSRGYTLMAAILPFSLVLSAYGLIYYLKYDDCRLQIKERTYLAFEQGQGVLYSEQYEHGNIFYEGQITARKLYGTPEQNNHSVFRAISRNPKRFLERLARTIRSIPERVLVSFGEVHGWLSTVNSFGKGLGLIMMLLALRGLISLIEYKHYAQLALIMLWPLHLLPYLLTFFRDNYFLFDYYIVIYLASQGIERVVAAEQHLREKLLWGLILVSLSLYGFSAARPLLSCSTLIFLLGLGLIWLIQKYNRSGQQNILVGPLMVIVLLLCMRGSFPLPNHAAHNLSPSEKSVLFLKQHFSADTKIAGVTSSIILCADMEPVYLSIELRALTTEQALLDWLQEKQVRAVLLDATLEFEQPELYHLLKNQVGQSFTTVYHDPQACLSIIEFVHQAK